VHYWELELEQPARIKATWLYVPGTPTDAPAPTFTLEKLTAEGSTTVKTQGKRLSGDSSMDGLALEPGLYRLAVYEPTFTLPATFKVMLACEGEGCRPYADQCVFGSSWERFLATQVAPVAIGPAATLDSVVVAGTPEEQALAIGRRDDLLALARTHGLGITEVADLFARVDGHTIETRSLGGGRYHAYTFSIGGVRRGGITRDFINEVLATIEADAITGCTVHPERP
jgi:hypothetical protein